MKLQKLHQLQQRWCSCCWPAECIFIPLILSGKPNNRRGVNASIFNGQVQAGSPTGRTRSRFDVYYFEICHRRKQSRGPFSPLCVCVPGYLSVCVCRDCLIFSLCFASRPLLACLLGVSIHQKGALWSEQKRFAPPQIASSRSDSGEGEIWGWILKWWKTNEPTQAHN